LLKPNYFGSTFPKFISITEDEKGKLLVLGQSEGQVHSFRWTIKNTLPKIDFESNCLLGIDVGSVSYPQFVDIDNDGDYDLFVGGGNDAIINDQGPGRHLFFFENIGDKANPKFQYRYSMYDTINYVSQFKFGDIDNDGDYDLLTGGSDRERKIKLYLNTGTKDSASFKLIDTAFITVYAQNGNFPSPLLLDIDGDSDLDLLVSYRLIVAGGPTVFLYRNDGNKFTPKWNLHSEGYSNLPYGVYETWDYDNDGDLDLLYAKTALKIYENIGDKYNANFKEKCTLSDIRFNGPYGVATLVDIDSDGDKDLFTGNGPGGISFYRNDTPTDVSKESLNKEYNYQLFQNYPNPFNPETTISFSINKASQVEVTIYNILGEKVRQLISQYLPAGMHQYRWDSKDQDGANVAAGIYIIKLKCSDQQLFKKALLLK
jgi:hypothetical protein